jgi:fructose-specific phosphotransferase system component IIB
MAELAGSFEQYGAWRDTLARAIVQFRRWLQENKLLDAEASRRIGLALDRLAEDKLVVAVVAEFSRGKSELINAIFFADCGRRILPTSAGRTTMCPTELMYDESLPPCIRALPIETRARAGGTAEFRKTADEWRTYPVDASSAEGMLEAFKLVSETVRVSAEEARLYGLFDPDEPDHQDAVDADGTVEISRWRHAVINFPHPLLRQGLVVLDTPGLNAIGAEPELTLSLVPSAHAVLFVLAADTGLTKSDLEMWRHLVRDSGASEHHIAVLNKIDGLWDGLKTDEQIDVEVQRQVDLVSQRLALSRSRVFAVSAQKGLLAKLQDDQALLAASRLPALENALVDTMLPAKQEIIRSRALSLVGRVGEEVRQTLAVRERGLVEQLYEMRSLQGKNQGSVGRMLLRAQRESAEFEKVASKAVATRLVLGKIAAQALAPLKREALRESATRARERMHKAWLPTAFAPIIGEYFDGLRDDIRQSNARIAEMHKMMVGVQASFAQELGWSLTPPMAFSIDSYLAEVDRLQEAARAQFATFAVLTRGKWGLIERFLETVVARSRDIFVAAERDVEAWIGSLLPPVEAQVREQRATLVRRAESVQKIRDAQESLEGRIGELDEALQAVRQKIESLKQQLDGMRAADGGAERKPAALAASRPAAGDRPLISAEELGLVRQRVSA